MEVGLIGKQAAGVARPELLPSGCRWLPLRDSVRGDQRPSQVGFGCARPFRLASMQVVAIRAGVRSELVAGEKKESPPMENKTGPIPVFVGLPVDAVSASNTVNHTKAIVTGLRALKLLGVYGVELPISWGVVAGAGGDWSSYQAVAGMVRDAGLRLRVSLQLHAGSRKGVPLPPSVSEAAAADPDLFFADRSGRRREEFLSFAVDELPVLEGGSKTPMQAYDEFFKSFRLAFADLIGSTITEITIGLGPNGELRYPSFPPKSNADSFTGVGEFQCYNKYMLADLKKHAEESGNPLWGLSGPHDAPEYNQSVESGNFFKEHGGSWEAQYGQFFLSWYSGMLLSHGDRMLAAASRVFGELPVTISAKVPLLHSWHNTRSRPSQLTAGFYNTDGRDGYDAVAEIFAKHFCTMIVPGMDMSDAGQSQSVRSSPQGLLSQISRACAKHGVRLAGENSSLAKAGSTTSFGRIKESILSEQQALESFTYHRMGLDFFSPEHWPLFTEFVRSLDQPEMDSDDLPSTEERLTVPINSAAPASVSSNDREMQAV